jgi:hypothetical protein
MDKSEGTDVVSKFLGSVSDWASKVYLKGQNSLSKLSLQRTRSEKIIELGAKLFKLLDSSAPVSAELFREEYDAIIRIDKLLSEQNIKEAQTAKPKGKARGRKKAAETEGASAQVAKPKGRVAKGKKVEVKAEHAVKPRGRKGGRKKAETSAPSAPILVDEKKNVENLSEIPQTDTGDASSSDT